MFLTPNSLRITVVKTLASLLSPKATIAASTSLTPNSLRAFSSVESAIKVVGNSLATSLAISSLLSIAITSIPLSTSSLTMLRPNCHNPITANDLWAIEISSYLLSNNNICFYTFKMNIFFAVHFSLEELEQCNWSKSSEKHQDDKDDFTSNF